MWLKFLTLEYPAPTRARRCGFFWTLSIASIDCCLLYSFRSSILCSQEEAWYGASCDVGVMFGFAFEVS